MKIPLFLYKSLHIHLKFMCALSVVWFVSTNWSNQCIYEITATFSLFSDNLKNGKFHQHLREIFAPQVIYFFQIDV